MLSSCKFTQSPCWIRRRVYQVLKSTGHCHWLHPSEGMPICRSWLMSGSGYMHLWSTKNCGRPVWRLPYIRTASTFMLCHMNYFVLQSVGNEHLAAYEVAKLPYNKTKNRFANIFPCEWTKGQLLVSWWLWWQWLVHVYTPCFRWLLSSEAPGDKGSGGIWICERLLHWCMYNFHRYAILWCKCTMITRRSIQLALWP